MRLKTLVPAVAGAGLALVFGPSAHAQELTPPPIPADAQTFFDNVTKAANDAAARVNADINAALANAGITPPPAPWAPQAPAAVDAVADAPAPATDGAATAPAADAAAPAAAADAQQAPALTADQAAQKILNPTAPRGGTPVLVESPIFIGPDGQPMVDIFKKPNGPNYTWVDDLRSQFLAMTPGKVLHRVDGSFFNAPDVPKESIQAQIYGKSLYGPGTPVYVGTKNLCTLGVAGYDKHGNKVGLTAGHCGNVGDEVYSADSWENGATGEVVATQKNGDYSVIKFGERTDLVRSYNGVNVNGFAAAPTNSFAQLCKMGVATGFTCGPNLVTTDTTNLSHVCAMQGDSGGPLLVGDRMVGIVSGGFGDLAPCRSPLQGPLFVPTIATPTEVIFAELDREGGVGAGFRLPERSTPDLT